MHRTNPNTEASSAERDVCNIKIKKKIRLHTLFTFYIYALTQTPLSKVTNHAFKACFYFYEFMLSLASSCPALLFELQECCVIIYVLWLLCLCLLTVKPSLCYTENELAVNYCKRAICYVPPQLGQLKNNTSGKKTALVKQFYGAFMVHTI